MRWPILIEFEQKMAFEKRRSILYLSEIDDDHHGIPAVDDEQRRHYFSLDRIEAERAACLRSISHRCFL